MRKTFFGWWIVGGAAGIQLLLNCLLLQAFGTYAAVWRDEFGWSKTAIAAAFSLQRGQRGLISPFQGWLLQKFGPRSVIRIGLILLSTGFMLLSQVNSLTTFYLTFLLMAVGETLAGPLSLSTVIVNWFERNRSTALATVQIGKSIGGLLVPLVALSITALGWEATALMSGILILFLGLPATQVMRSTPERYGLVPDGNHCLAIDAAFTSRVALHDAKRVNFAPRQALRTRAFWFLSFGHALAVAAVSAVIVHLVIYLNEELGYSLQAAATVVALMTAFAMAGQIIGGFFGDRFNKRLIATFAMFGHASALLALAFADSFVWVVLFAVVHGLSWGMRGPQMHALRADYFGRVSFATIMGFSTTIAMIGMVGGPLIAGYVADLLGGYKLAFILLAGLSAFGSLFFIFASEPISP